MVISQPSTLLISSYAKAAYLLHASCTFSFSLYSTVKMINLYLSPQALIRVKITAGSNGVWKDYLLH